MLLHIYTNCIPSTFPVMYRSEPLKKKKKSDTQTLVAKEQRKKKRLQKSIKRLQQKGRLTRPVEEISGFRHVIKTLRYASYLIIATK